jgi:hypothetical protein
VEADPAQSTCGESNARSSILNPSPPWCRSRKCHRATVNWDCFQACQFMITTPASICVPRAIWIAGYSGRSPRTDDRALSIIINNLCRDWSCLRKVVGPALVWSREKRGNQATTRTCSCLSRSIDTMKRQACLRNRSRHPDMSMALLPRHSVPAIVLGAFHALDVRYVSFAKFL